MNSHLEVFISSKMQELKPERDMLDKWLPSLSDAGIRFHVWQFEAQDGAPASNESIRSVYLQSLEDAALYIGIFWNQYGEWTIDEFNHATEWGIDRHIYLKDVEADRRDSELTKFLRDQEEVESGITVKRFKTLEDLRDAVQYSVTAWIKQRKIQRPGSISAIINKHPDDILERSKFFTGRDHQLNSSYDFLILNMRVLLQGFGGMGKTALAAEICSKWIVAHQGEVLWLRTGNNEAEEIFEALARPFNLHESIAKVTGDAKVQAIRQLLTSSGVKLLVLDDVWNGKALMHVLKAIPSSLPILVTSRNRYPGFRIVPVTKLDRADSKKMISHYSYLNSLDDDSDLDKLSAKLGDNTFALRIAGMTMHVDNLSAAKLLEQIELAPHELKVPLGFHNEYEESIASVIDVSLNSLYLSGREGKETHRLFLAFGALFAPSATVELLISYLKIITRYSITATTSSRTTIEQQLLELQRRGLADKMEHKNVSSGPTFYEIHDLSFSYVRARTNNNLLQKGIDTCSSFIQHHELTTGENIRSVLPVVDNLIGAALYAFEMERFEDLEIFARILGGADGNKTLRYAGLHKKTLILLKLAVEAADRRQNSFLTITNLSSLAWTYKSLGQFKDALTCYEKALAIEKSMSNKHVKALILGDMSDAHRFLGNYEMAISCSEEATAILSEQKDDINLSKQVRSLGLIYHHMGQYQNALEKYNNALIMARVRNDLETVADILGDIGIISTDLSKYEDSIKCHEEGIEISRQLFDKVGECCHLGNLGYVYVSCHEYKKSISYYNQALEIIKETGDLSWKATYLGGLGRAFTGLKEYNKAFERLEEALNLNEQLGNKRGYAIVHGYLANLYMEQNQSGKAIIHYRIAIDEGGDDKAGLASWSANVASLYLREGDCKNAIEQYHKALLLFKQIGDTFNLGMTQYHTARVYQKINNKIEATNLLEQARAIFVDINRREMIEQIDNFLKELN